MKLRCVRLTPILLSALILLISATCSASLQSPKAHRQARMKSFNFREYLIPVETDRKSSGNSRTNASNEFFRRKLLSGGIHARSATLTPMEPIKAPDAVSNAAASSKTAVATSTKKDKITKLDVSIFVTYFCNIVVLTLSVVTVPAIAIEHNLGPKAMATFCAKMASMAPLGGFVGKLVNGFVCQYLGGRDSSCVYMLALAGLSLGMSFTRSLAPVGLFLLGFEFLTSIQWTSSSSVLYLHYRQNPRLITRGLALLSISSTTGALFAKTFGSGLLRATQWRTVARFGALMAFIGAMSIYFGGAKKSESSFASSSGDARAPATKVTAGGQQQQSPLATLRTVLSNPVFWMVSIGHSLGHISRISDRLLGPFLQEVGGISSTLAVTLTSSVTIGFILGLFRGSVFSKLQSVETKMNMVKRSYVAAVLSTIGLAACGIQGVSKLFGGSANAIIAAITIFSGVIASAVSFQFYQIPNLVSSTMFPNSSSVALSLTDAIGFLVTAGVMGVNTLVLGNFGWSASWSFMVVVFSLGGASMVRALRPVLVENAKMR